MRCVLSALVLLNALVFAPVAFADVTTTFNLENATFSDGATASGTVSIDTTTGAYAGANLLFSDGAFSALFTPSSRFFTFDDGTDVFFDFTDAAGDLLHFDLPGPT